MKELTDSMGSITAEAQLYGPATGMAKQCQSDGEEVVYTHAESMADLGPHRDFELFELRLEQESRQQQTRVKGGQSDESHVAKVTISSSSSGLYYDGLADICRLPSIDLKPAPLSFEVKDIGDGEYMGFYKPAPPELAPVNNSEEIGDGLHMGFYNPLSPEQHLVDFFDAFDAEIYAGEFNILDTYCLSSENYAYVGFIEENMYQGDDTQRLNKRNLGSEDETQQHKKIKPDSDIKDDFEIISLLEDSFSMPHVASNQGNDTQNFDTTNMISLGEVNKQKGIYNPIW